MVLVTWFVNALKGLPVDARQVVSGAVSLYELPAAGVHTTPTDVSCCTGDKARLQAKARAGGGWA